jgi:hypothetical protein
MLALAAWLSLAWAWTIGLLSVDVRLNLDSRTGILMVVIRRRDGETGNRLRQRPHPGCVGSTSINVRFTPPKADINGEQSIKIVPTRRLQSPMYRSYESPFSNRIWVSAITVPFALRVVTALSVQKIVYFHQSGRCPLYAENWQRNAMGPEASQHFLI